MREFGHFVRGEGRTRNLNHGAKFVIYFHPLFVHHRFRFRLQRRLLHFQLVDVRRERDHHLRMNGDALFSAFAGSFKDGAHLHPRQFGDEDAEADAARAQHGVHLAQGFHALQERLFYLDLGEGGVNFAHGMVVLQAHLQVGQGLHQFLVGGQELVQGGVNEADDHGQTVHGAEQAFKVVALEGEQFFDSFVLLHAVLRHNHLLHGRQALRLKEHMLRAAEANALRSIFTGAGGVVRVVCVGPHAQGAEFVGPTEQFEQIGVFDVGNDGLESTQVHFARCAVNGNPVTFFDGEHFVVLLQRHDAAHQVNFQLAHAHDGGFTELAGDEGGVAGAPAAAGEDAFGGQHAMYIVRLGFGANHDHIAAIFARPFFGQVGVKGDDAHGRAGGDVEAGGNGVGFTQGGQFKLGMEEEVYLGGLDAADGDFLVDEAFFDHVHGDADFRLGGALAIAGLQQPQLAVFDGEFHVLHVAVVVFEFASNFREFGV